MPETDAQKLFKALYPPHDLMGSCTDWLARSYIFAYTGKSSYFT